MPSIVGSLHSPKNVHCFGAPGCSPLASRGSIVCERKVIVTVVPWSGALNRDLPGVAADHRLHERHPQPGSVARRLAIEMKAPEAFEQMRLLLKRNAVTRVPHHTHDRARHLRDDTVDARAERAVFH